MANTAYSITGHGDNVQSIRDYSDSGWDGVYVGLDKTYYANQSFTVSFTVNQRNLLSRSTNNWGINFTPGYYDNAKIGKMDIVLVSPIDPTEYSYSMVPTSIAGNTMTWEKTNLPGGYQFNVSVGSEDGSFLLASVTPSQTATATVLPITSPSIPFSEVNGFGIIFCIAVAAVVVAAFVNFIVKTAKNRAAYSSPEVSPIANKKWFNPASLEEQKKVLESNADKVNEYILTEKDKIPDDQKTKQINDFAAQHNLFLNGNDYIDDYGHSYNNNMLWMMIMMNNMQAHNAAVQQAATNLSNRSSFHNNAPPSFINTPSCHCACVACACACACACAGGHAAGCTVKLKNFKLENKND